MAINRVAVPFGSLRAVNFQAPSNSCACARAEHSTTKIAANQRIHMGFCGRLCIVFVLFSLSLYLADGPLPVLSGTQPGLLG
jgi:hypothetical protein